MSWVLTLNTGSVVREQKSPGQAGHRLEAAALEPDQELMLRVKAGDAQAFNLLMEKYQRVVLNLVYRFTGDSENAEDLAQEVFLRIYRAADRYEPRAKFFTYLYQVTLNLCRNARDKSQRRKAQSLDQESSQGLAPLEIADSEPGVEDHLVRLDVAQQVQSAISTLPAEQRELLVLQRFHELGYEELSEVTGQTISAVKAKLHRARLALKKKLGCLLGGEVR